MFQLTWGGYVFGAGATTVSSRITTIRDTGGNPKTAECYCDVAGWLQADTQALLDTAIRALSAALMVPFQDLILWTDETRTVPTTTVLRNAGSRTGTVVVSGPVFDRNSGAELSTLRHFTFSVHAIYDHPSLTTLVGSSTDGTYPGGVGSVGAAPDVVIPFGAGQGLPPPGQGSLAAQGGGPDAALAGGAGSSLIGGTGGLDGSGYLP